MGINRNVHRRTLKKDKKYPKIDFENLFFFQPPLPNISDILSTDGGRGGGGGGEEEEGGGGGRGGEGEEQEGGEEGNRGGARPDFGEGSSASSCSYFQVSNLLDS